jgi:hypothetical protein
MRRSAQGLVGVAVVAGLTAGTMIGAQASVAEKSAKKFCETALAISTTEPDGFDDAALIEVAEDFVKEYKKLAKQAPTGKLRKAAKVISKYYARVVESGDPNKADIFTDKEVDAVSAISAYNIANCAGAGVVPAT